MTKVITYGTFDLLHRGHIRLLERAKALGDYLIVGVTSDDFDRARGKINVQQPLMERLAAVEATGLADEIIIEEYEGQKIDDIQRMGVDIFTVGSDWVGKFDYLNEWCKVIYLDRTKGVSSTQLRSERNHVRMGFVGDPHLAVKVARESSFVDGIEAAAILLDENAEAPALPADLSSLQPVTNFDELLEVSDALYIVTRPEEHFTQVKAALEHGLHVLCESPIAPDPDQLSELSDLASQKGLVLSEGIKTAHSMAFERMLLLLKAGGVGRILSVDATCTSMREFDRSTPGITSTAWNSISAWGPTAMLPIFQLLGTDWRDKRVVASYLDEEKTFDGFSRIDFTYADAVATAKVGRAAKSEGELVVTGTKGYAYVPAPWWKTDYFEVRHEDPSTNKRYFYQLDGEGIRNELVDFVHQIENGGITYVPRIPQNVSLAIAQVIRDFNDKVDLTEI